MQSSYKYLPLDDVHDQIRLLTIPPVTSAEFFQVSLSTYSIQDLLNDAVSTPKWEALSYTWDDQDLNVPLVVDGQTLLMSASVVHAIDGLLLQHKSRVLWIDAICINQANIVERNDQIQHMALIYKHASRVIVWLQDHIMDLYCAENQFLAVRFFCDDARHGNFLKWSCLFESAYLRVLSQIDATAETTSDLQHPDDLHDWATFCLGHLLNDPWFTRVWIVQEVVLATWVVVRIGTRLMPWEMLVKAVGSLRSDLLQSDRARKLVNDSGLGMTIFDGIESISQMRVDYQNGQRSSLLDLLRLTELKAASDDRDKIYGVVGMLNGTDHSPERAFFPFKPDYRVSVEKTYIELTLWIVQKEGSLDVLNGKQSASKISGKYSLPSWVPDWSHKSESWHTPWRRYQKIGEKSRPVWSYIPSKEALIVRGYIQGTVSFCPLKTFESHDEDCCKFMTCVWDEWREALTHTARNHAFADKDRLLFAFWYAIILGVPKRIVVDAKAKLSIVDGRNADKSHGSSLELLIDKLEEWYQQRQFQGLTELVTHDTYTKGDRMVATEDGIIGVVDNGVAKGDIICTLMGAANPVILHPLCKPVTMRSSMDSRRQITMPVYRLVGGTTHIPLYMGDAAVQTMIRDKMPHTDFCIV